MTKRELQNLARTDNIEVQFSGKNKTAYLKFRGAINAGYAQKYRSLFSDIGYSVKSQVL